MSGSIRVVRVADSPLWAIRSSYFSPALVDHAKAVPGMRYDNPTRAWQGYADAVIAVVARLSTKGIRVDGGADLPDPESWRTARSPFLFSTQGLRDYQVEGVRFLIAKAREGALLADGMRLGKSLQSIIAARAFKGKTLVICPSHVVGVWSRPKDATEGPGEIAKWWPDAWRGAYDGLAPAVGYPGVVCLETVKPFAAQEVIRKLAGVARDKLDVDATRRLAAAQAEIESRAKTLQHAQVIVCHYDIIYAWVDVLKLWGVATLILDECFPTGTLVDTPEGSRAIETLRPGAHVFNALGIGAVTTKTTRTVFIEDMRLVRLDDDREFICTVRHPMLTWGGWKQTGELGIGDRLLDLGAVHMLTRRHGVQLRDSTRALRAREETLGIQDMSELRQEETDLAAESLLLKTLLDEAEMEGSEVRSATTRVPSRFGVQSAHAPINQEIAPPPARAGATVGRAHAEAQPDVDAWHPREGNSLAASEGLGPAGTWGQRPANTKSRKHLDQSARGAVDTSVSCINGEASTPRLPDVLQDRRRASDKEDRRRGRRRQSSHGQTESSRRQEGRLLEGLRVVHIAIPQRADFQRLGLGAPDDSGHVRVHNLQVSGHPSYAVANGLVAHNCHILAGWQSRRSDALKELSKIAPRRIGLTGTPVTNLPKNLHNVLEILCENRFGYFFTGARPGCYSRLFCDSFQKTVGEGENQKTVWDHSGRSNLDVPDGKYALTKEETLHARLKFLMLRRLKKDVDPQIPAKVRQIIDVSIPARHAISVSDKMLGSGGAELRRCLDLAADGKFKSVVGVVEGHVAEGEKVICACYRRLFAERIADGVRVSNDSRVVFVHGGLSPKERDRRIHSLKVHKGPGVLAGTIDTISTGIDLSFAGVMVVGELTWEHHELEQCLDSKTEILTPYGFVPKGTIKKGDLVAAFNIETEEIAYLPALRVVERALGATEQMFGIEGARLDLRVTGRHRMVVKHEFGGRNAKRWTGWKFETAEQASTRSQKYRLPAAGYKKAAGIPLTDDEIRVVGWYLTDGSLNGGDLSISQSIASKHTRDLIRSITRAGMRYTTTVVRAGTASQFKRNYDQVTYHIARFNSRTHKKRGVGWYKIAAYLDKNLSPLLFEMTRRQLAVLLEAIHWGDGSKESGRGWQRQTYHIATGNRMFADRLQQLCIERGFRANIVRYKSPYYFRGSQPNKAKGSIELLSSGRVSARMPNRSRVGTFDTVPAARKALRLAIADLPKRLIEPPLEVKSLLVHTAKKHVFTINVGAENWRTVEGTSVGRTSLKRVRANQQARRERVWCASNAWGTLIVRRNGQTAIVGNCEERLYAYGKDVKALIEYIIARGTGDELVLRGIINKIDTADRVIGSTKSGLKETLEQRKADGLKRLHAALLEMQKAPVVKAKRRPKGA